MLVLFEQQIDQRQLQQIKKIEAVKQIVAFSPYRSNYFSRLYSLHVRQHLWQRDLPRLHAIAPVVSVETPTEVRPLSIFPNPDAPPITNDPFSRLQWALDNNGQRILMPMGTDIDSEYIYSVPGADIGTKNILTELEAKMERDMLIGVLDFGLDYLHPDIINNIAYNSIECNTDSSGRIYRNPYEPKEDRDGNGYKGDCIGWNFDESNDLQGDNRPIDEVIGHGTHVTGIIAAERDNAIGTAGVSNKLKVVPIKVMHDDQNEDGEDSVGISFTDRVAKGILYAIIRGVDVINLSLGWPSALDHQHIRKAIQEALNKDIIIVAAAGNNKNNRPIAPCSYPGVICVGSSRIDKKISSFSNFGGHVDLLAPGDFILSLFPKSAHNTLKTGPSIFNFPGYEIKNGTSQSAPFLSAAAALLKGALGINSDQVKARLFSTAEDLADRDKYFRNGLIHVERAYRQKPHPRVEAGV